MQSIGVVRRCLFGRDADWDGAFNFSKKTGFITSCAKKTKGKITHAYRKYIISLREHLNGLKSIILVQLCYMQRIFLFSFTFHIYIYIYMFLLAISDDLF
jgi:hypothetical protein